MSKALHVLPLLLLVSLSLSATSLIPQAHAATPPVYWFQVGVFAESNFGPITGDSVEIRILSPQALTDSNADLSYWVGISLPNNAFIQVGYLIWQSKTPQSFWTYIANTSEEDSAYKTTLGSEIGANNTWVKFSLEADKGTVWGVYLDDVRIGEVDLGAGSTNTGPYAFGEVARTIRTDNQLAAEFRNLAYRDTSSNWHLANSGSAYCCYGAGSDTLPSSVPYPYDVITKPGENNHWTVVTTRTTESFSGRRLWPWYQVDVTSDIGRTSGSGWYIQGSTVQPQVDTLQSNVTPEERLVFTGWRVNNTQPTSTDANITLTVESNLSLSASYSKQFYVNVTSSMGATSGTGWYDEGANATFSVEPAKIPSSTWLSIFRVGKDFDRWTGNYSAQDNPATLPVNDPKQIQAAWRTDYGVLPILTLMIVGLLGVGILLLRRRRG